MKMSDLILAIGDDNVKFQNLFDSMNSISTSKKGVSKISFSTDGVTANEVMSPDTSKNVGLVLWLPRDKVEAALEAMKATKQ
jgi:hypothetical protein